MLNRRSLLLSASAALALPYVSRAHAATGEIVIGTAFDVTGIFQPLGRPKANVMQMAIDETNAAGGILGKKVRLVQYDTQSSNQLYAQYGQAMVRSDKVDFAFAGVTSASREILRPILRRANVPYFYNMAYEGGLCAAGTWMTGITTPQIAESLLPYMAKTYGKKVYLVAPDHSFGQDSEIWLKHYAQKLGLEVVGSERFPLDASNFSATLSKIQAAAPDFVIDSFVTMPQFSFYNQWAAAGLKGKIGLGSITLGSMGQNLILPAEVLDGVIVGIDYVQEMDTPANKAFIAKYQERFGTSDYVGNLAAIDYDGWQIFKAACEKAGSTDKDAVAAALGQGLTLETLRGEISLDPKTQHCTMDVHIMEVQAQSYRLIETTKAVAPADVVGRCDLIAEPQANLLLRPEA